VTEILSLVVFFIMNTLLFLSVVDLKVLCCNPQTKGLYILHKGCAGVSVFYMGTIFITGLVSVFSTSHFPLESFIQAKMFGMVLPSLGYKAIYYKMAYIFLSELRKLEILPDGCIDLEAAERAFAIIYSIVKNSPKLC
jgi:hypothetical protein